MKKIILAITAVLTMSSCEKSAIETKNTNNPDFKVEHLFTVDSCKIYRFSDNGNYHYIGISNKQMFTITEQGSGKHSYEESIYTQN